jgi:capsular exopolysaccharide synthesis family protein
MINLSGGAGIGFLIAFAAMLALEYLDDRVKTGEDVARVLRLRSFGTVSRITGMHRPADGLVAIREPDAANAEAYRALWSSIERTSLMDASRVLLISSAVPDEGKTTTACNLAAAAAMAGKRVILCDADMRRPRVQELYGLSGRLGLSTLLADDAMPVASALADSGVSGLKILPSGPRPPSPVLALGSVAMKRRIEELKGLAEVVIIDTPAALAVADATVLGSLCDEAVMVIDSSRTRVGLVRSARADLEQSGVNVVGVILNKVSGRGAGYHPYYYGSDSQSGGPGSRNRTARFRKWLTDRLPRLVRRGPARELLAESRSPEIATEKLTS